MPYFYPVCSAISDIWYKTIGHVKKDVSKTVIGRFEAAFDEARKKYFANND